MKKLMFFVAILVAISFQANTSFGQTEWGQWNNVSCFKGLQFSVKYYGVNKVVNQNQWNIKMRNNYGEKVDFDLSITFGQDVQSLGNFTVAANAERGYTSFFSKDPSTNPKVQVKQVCFPRKGLGCGSQKQQDCYAICDEGSPNIPTGCSGNSSANGSSEESNTRESNNSSDKNSLNNSNGNTPKNTNADTAKESTTNNFCEQLIEDYHKELKTLSQIANYPKYIEMGKEVVRNCSSDIKRIERVEWIKRNTSQLEKSFHCLPLFKKFDATLSQMPEGQEIVYFKSAILTGEEIINTCSDYFSEGQIANIKSVMKESKEALTYYQNNKP